MKKDLAEVWVWGSIATILLAVWLWNSGEKAEAAALILASPFPCPTGLPC